MGFEMISIKSPREIEAMRRAGRITAQARALAGSMVKPGVTTLEIDTAVRRYIESQGAKPSFLGYSGFPGSACISVVKIDMFSDSESNNISSSLFFLLIIFLPL
jgi:methionyl aminopeptidase